MYIYIYTHTHTQTKNQYHIILCSPDKFNAFMFCMIIELFTLISGASLVAQMVCGRSGVDRWVGKLPWRSEWQPTPVFLQGEFHGKRSLVSCSPWGHKESDTTK